MKKKLKVYAVTVGLAIITILLLCKLNKKVLFLIVASLTLSAFLVSLRLIVVEIIQIFTSRKDE